MGISIRGLYFHEDPNVDRATRFDQKAHGKTSECDGSRAWDANGGQNCAKVVVFAVDNPTKVCASDGNLGRHDDGRVQDSSGCGTHILVDAERVGCDRECKNGHVSGARGTVGPCRLLSRRSSGKEKAVTKNFMVVEQRRGSSW